LPTPIDMKVGWIGTGRMGFTMARRLARAGCKLTVWNRTRAKAERLAHEARTEANRQNFLRKEVEWLRRQPKARTTKQKARIQRAEAAIGTLAFGVALTLALLLLLPAGVLRIVMTDRRPIPVAILAGFLTGPLAAVLVGELAIHRALFMLPFGALRVAPRM